RGCGALHRLGPQCLNALVYDICETPEVLLIGIDLHAIGGTRDVERHGLLQRGPPTQIHAHGAGSKLSFSLGSGSSLRPAGAPNIGQRDVEAVNVLRTP